MGNLLTKNGNAAAGKNTAAVENAAVGRTAAGANKMNGRGTGGALKGVGELITLFTITAICVLEAVVGICASIVLPTKAAGNTGGGLREPWCRLLGLG